MIIKKGAQKAEKKNKNISAMPQNEALPEFSANINDTIIESGDSKEENDKLAEEYAKNNIDLFDIENIDFTQRQERRRGTRRRGYRRIDDRNLVSRAKEESENIKKSAFEEGYRIGLETAENDLENFRNKLSNFMNTRTEVFEYIAPDILEISVNIAKTIIKKELESDPQVLINTIMDVLKKISKSEPKISIKVNPKFVQFIKDTIPNITYEYGIDTKINIIADPSVEESGCVLQTNNGIVDASIDTQLEIIKKAFQGLNSGDN